MQISRTKKLTNCPYDHLKVSPISESVAFYMKYYKIIIWDTRKTKKL